MNAPVLTRLQPHWDWRAAGNFIFGGAGAGLLVFALTAGGPDLRQKVLAAAGLALVGLGLFCVWLEIGRPLRAMHVYFHLWRSWMSREALAAVFLFLLGTGYIMGMHWRAWPMVAAAGVFLYCQASIIGASRAIPAWREPLTVPLLLATGIAEGAGLYWVVLAWERPPIAVATTLWLLVLVRWGVWLAWRQRLNGRASPAALRVIDEDGRIFCWVGCALPVVLVPVALNGWVRPAWATALLAIAGLLVLATGAMFKFNLVTRAGFHRGFTLPRMPVRGVARN
ncbi:MAG: dimethyl sulfoxide reductase anchor subunit [Burkholderiales bacterium]|nr:dimethyl sulfoxide reductase anchor subunit [Burkholderiales bacterium]